MRTSFLSSACFGLTTLALVGCSGSSDMSSALSVRCGTGGAFCIVSCDLGCNQTGGCSLSEIAENQTLRFVFNKAIHPESVNTSSLSIRTSSGHSPSGDLLVRDTEILFVPRITTSQGVTRFGFQRNETYIITIAGGGTGGQVVRSISGDPLRAEFTCTVRATLGIVDLDQSPPRAELLFPAMATNVPLTGTVITLRFSELIDSGPFLSGSTLNLPIIYQLKRVVAGTETCDLASTPVPLEGAVQVSVERVGSVDVSKISMNPSVALPGLACVEVIVTTGVRDLAGKAAIPATFRFITTAGTIEERNIVETFAGPAKLDARVSSGTWNVGARPGRLGGDGRHGSFDAASPTTGLTVLGTNSYQWSTDNLVIPGSRTISGQPEQITDGRFYFTDFTLPQGYTLTFVGTRLPQIVVRGRTEIFGRIHVNAPKMTTFVVTNNQNHVPTNILPGQPGGLGGLGGGRGGQGGNRSNGITTPPPANNNGQPGETVQVPGTHAYASSRIGTGGPGAPVWPASGLFTAVTRNLSSVCGQISAGGGGGGFFAPGLQGRVSVATTGTSPSGPVAGGNAFDNRLYLLPVPVGTSSLDHFMIGGSGGGGGGSHPYMCLANPPPPGVQNTDVYRAGAGGSGGGGVIALRSGSDLTVHATGRVEARGGEGIVFQEAFIPPQSLPSPGGGGSGGSVVLQSSGTLVVQGAVDTSGGPGSESGPVTQPIPAWHSVSVGGAGSPGFYRLEASGAVSVTGVGMVPPFDPSINVGALNDRDDTVGQASTWYSTARIFPPEWLRYEIEVDVDGTGTNIQIFSDDPAVGPPANSASNPVRIQFQVSVRPSNSRSPVRSGHGAPSCALPADPASTRTTQRRCASSWCSTAGPSPTPSSDG
jgi:hypothetical protein